MEEGHERQYRGSTEGVSQPMASRRSVAYPVLEIYPMATAFRPDHGGGTRRSRPAGWRSLRRVPTLMARAPSAEDEAWHVCSMRINAKSAQPEFRRSAGPVC